MTGSNQFRKYNDETGGQRVCFNNFFFLSINVHYRLPGSKQFRKYSNVCAVTLLFQLRVTKSSKRQIGGQRVCSNQFFSELTHEYLHVV